MATLPCGSFMLIAAVVMKNSGDIHLNTLKLNFRYKQVKEEFEDTKGVIRIRISKNN